MGRLGTEDRVALQETPETWRFDLRFHPAQQAIWEDPARFKVVAAGRRFGKTTLAMAFALVVATSRPNALVLWAAPNHDTARKAMRAMLRLIPRRYREANRTTQEIFLSTGGIIMFRSAERFDNLRGDGLDAAVCDEAAFMPEAAWTQAIRPALSDKKGVALLISTFDGENWFWHAYRRAIEPKNVLWQGWTFTTLDNPYIDPQEVEDAKATLPREVFLQEFMASPMAFAGAVFPSERIEKATSLGRNFRLELRSVRDGRPTLLKPEAGLDWGHQVTAFELCVELGDGRVAWVGEEIFEKVELTARCRAIAEICRDSNVETIYADAAGASENVTLAKVLAEVGAPTYVQPVPFNVYKRPAIVTRSWFLEQEREVLTDGCPQLIVDSKAYHYDKSGDRPAKGNDHTVDAATCFYASRASSIGDLIGEAEEAVA